MYYSGPGIKIQRIIPGGFGASFPSSKNCLKFMVAEEDHPFWQIFSYRGKRSLWQIFSYRGKLSLWQIFSYHRKLSLWQIFGYRGKLSLLITVGAAFRLFIVSLFLPKINRYFRFRQRKGKTEEPAPAFPFVSPFIPASGQVFSLSLWPGLSLSLWSNLFLSAFGPAFPAASGPAFSAAFGPAFLPASNQVFSPSLWPGFSCNLWPGFSQPLACSFAARSSSRRLFCSAATAMTCSYISSPTHFLAY